MTKVLASDFRINAPSGAPKIEVEYDPAAIQEFDTRGKSPTRWQETWGQKVDVEIGGERSVLYIVLYSRSIGQVHETKNLLKSQ